MSLDYLDYEYYELSISQDGDNRVTDHNTTATTTPWDSSDAAAISTSSSILSFEDDEKTELSVTQEKILAILPIPAALLSIFGSTAIIYMAFKKRRQQPREQKWMTPYTRLLLAVSLCDIIASITYALQTFLRPSDTSQRVWAFGNDASCSAMGTLGQFAVANMLYNASLSFYFLCTARLGLKSSQIAKWIEPIMHFASLGFPLATAASGAIMGVYSETTLGMGCWVNDYPRNCGDGPENTGEECKAALIGWIFWGLPFLLVLFCIFFNNLIITCFVRRQTWPQRRKEKRKRKAETRLAASSSRRRTVETAYPSQSHPNNSISHRNEDNSGAFSCEVHQSVFRSCHNGGDDTSFIQISPVRVNSSTGWNMSDRDGSSTVFHRSPQDHNNYDPEPSHHIQPREHNNAAINIENDEHYCDEEEDIEEIQEEVKEAPRRKDQRSTLRSDQIRRLQLVSSQALFFVGSYLICNGWSGLLAIYESTTDSDQDESAISVQAYPLLLLQAILLPMQGLFNMFVFIRPKYMKCRIDFPAESKFWAFRRAMGQDVTPTKEEEDDFEEPESSDANQQQRQQKASYDEPIQGSTSDHNKNGTVTGVCIDGKQQASRTRYSLLPKGLISSLTANTLEERDQIERKEIENQDRDKITSVPFKDKRWNKTQEDLSAWMPMKPTQRCKSNVRGVSSLTASQNEDGDDDSRGGVDDNELCQEQRGAKQQDNKNYYNSIDPTDSRWWNSTPCKDTRWKNNTKQDLSAWVPMKQSRRYKSSASGSRGSRGRNGSSLEVISELSELSFVEPTPAESSDDEDHFNPSYSGRSRWTDEGCGPSSSFQSSLKKKCQRHLSSLSIPKQPESLVEIVSGIMHNESDSLASDEWEPSGRSRWGDGSGEPSYTTKNTKNESSSLTIPLRNQSIIEFSESLILDDHKTSSGDSNDGNSNTLFDRMGAVAAPTSDCSTDMPMRVPTRRMSPTPLI